MRSLSGAHTRRSLGARGWAIVTAKLLARLPSETTWHEVGRTETVKDNLNPKFTKQFQLDYHFEEQQPLRFAVYDQDSRRATLADHDLIGVVDTTLGNIMGHRGDVTEPIHHPSSRSFRGQLVVRARAQLPREATMPLTRCLWHWRGCCVALPQVHAEEMQSCNDELIVQFSGRGLDKKDFFGKSDPFLVIRRLKDVRSRGGASGARADARRVCVQTGELVSVCQTDVQIKTLNPVWAPMRIRVQQLCNGDIDRCGMQSATHLALA